MWFQNLQTFLTSPWFSLTLFALIFALVLKIQKLQQQQIQLGSAASLKQDLLQQTIIQKGENLYQLAAAWLGVSDNLQQLNYDYLNARIMPEDYAFQLDHLLDEPGYDVGQIEMLIQVYFPSLLPQFEDIKHSLKRLAEIFDHYDFDPINSTDLARYNQQWEILGLQSTAFKRMLSMQIQMVRPEA